MTSLCSVSSNSRPAPPKRASSWGVRGRARVCRGGRQWNPRSKRQVSGGVCFYVGRLLNKEVLLCEVVCCVRLTTVGMSDGVKLTPVHGAWNGLEQRLSVVLDGVAFSPGCLDSCWRVKMKGLCCWEGLSVSRCWGWQRTKNISQCFQAFLW